MPPSRPSFPEINAQLEAHEVARRLESEKLRIDGAFAGIARQHDVDRKVDEAWRRDQDVAILMIARACGVEEQIPAAIAARARASAAAAPKPKAALPGIGADARQTRFYSLLAFGAGLIELAIRLLDHLDHPGIK